LKKGGRLVLVMSTKSTTFFSNQIKNGLLKLEKKNKSESHLSRVDHLVTSLTDIGINKLPQFDSVDEFLNEVNDVNSDAHKIDNVLALPENIKHQTGRGELSMFLMLGDSRKSNIKRGETGDVTLNDKSYELKKESGIIDFAIKTRGEVTDRYNELVMIRSFCDKILNAYFVDSNVTKYFNQYFRKKITEFSSADFELFDNLLAMIKSDTDIRNKITGTILIDVINNFSAYEWRKKVAQLIVKSYSGGVIVYRKSKKGNRKVKRVDSKYELLDAKNVIVQNLTLGNIQLKIIN
jgi:hypothetical protein